MKDTQKAYLKKVNGENDIPFVSEGIAAEASGYILSENALTSLVEAAMNNEGAATKVTALTEQLETANAAKTTAEESLKTANESISAKDEEIVKLKADLEAAESRADEMEEATRETDASGKGKVPFHLSDDNPMNKIADSVFGKPVTKKK